MLEARFETMIRDISRSFAKRLVQEAEMQEQTFAAGACPNCGHDWTAHSSFIARGEKVCEEFDPFLDEREYEDAQQKSQALIHRMCASPLVVLMEDEPVHTDEHPFCDDPACPCHGCETWEQVNYQTEHLEQPFDNGLLTVAEYHRLFWNKQV